MFLTVLDGPAKGRVIKLEQTSTVGRDPDCALVLDQDDRVSRQHASFAPQADGTVLVTDLGSTNGVFVGSQRVTTPVTLRSGDTVRVGHTSLSVRTNDPSASPATVIGAESPAAVAAPIAARASTPVLVPVGPSTPATTPPAPPGATTVATKGRGRLVALVAAGLATAIVIVGGIVVLTRGGGSTPEAVTDNARRGVLQVQAEIDGQLQGTGTGWVYDIDNGLIVTNYHVVGVGTTFSVGIGPDRRAATLVGAAPCDDLAVLRVDRTDDLIELPLGDQSSLRNGQEVVALGYPGTASETPTLVTSTGSISSPSTSFDSPALNIPRYPNVILTQTPINPGNSGGPLLDLDGNVIGVNSAGSVVNQNQNYAIGADRLREVLPDLAAGNSYGWNGFLFYFPESPDEIEGAGYDPALFGQVIFALDAVPQSPAANSGFLRQLGGIAPIVSIDNVPLDGTLPGLCKTIAGKRRGDTSNFGFTDGVDIFAGDVGYS